MTIYSIKELADLAQVSRKTLRYYDQIELLSPHSYSDTGYRLYSQLEVTKLHHILLYKELGLSLAQIKDILQKEQSPLQLLTTHRDMLLSQRKDLENLLQHVNQRIDELSAGQVETTSDTFAAFQAQLKKNEQRHGQELRLNYGEALVNQSFATMSQFTKDDQILWQQLEQEILAELSQNLAANAPVSNAGTLFNHHKKWLRMSWGSYTSERHQGLAQLYLLNSDFQDYYDSQAGPGATNYLVQVILAHS